MQVLIHSPADRARASFISRCLEVALDLGCIELRELVDAARALEGKPGQPWLTLQRELNAWGRVYAIKGPVEAAEWFDGIAKALGSDARWEFCRKCNDTKATCCECTNASDDCECANGSIEVPCKCEGVSRG